LKELQHPKAVPLVHAPSLHLLLISKDNQPLASHGHESKAIEIDIPYQNLTKKIKATIAIFEDIEFLIGSSPYLKSEND
jgi:hypothetical protein